jgi:preprotein translocase subunit SecE
VSSIVSEKTSVSKAETEKKPNRLAEYFREARAELRRTTWPTREEALNLTWIVLIVTVVMAILLWLLGDMFSSIIGQILTSIG